MEIFNLLNSAFTLIPYFIEKFFRNVNYKGNY